VQFEIGDLTTLPNYKSISFERGFDRAASGNGPIADGPEITITRPTREIVAVEK
jgi:hypothetical protein